MIVPRVAGHPETVTGTLLPLVELFPSAVATGPRRLGRDRTEKLSRYRIAIGTPGDPDDPRIGTGTYT